MRPTEESNPNSSEMSLREARVRYFADNGFPADGGYAAPMVHLQMGPIHLAFPNSPARVRAVRFHDLHHLVTGYGTTWTGEAEIAAWEIASGCGRHLAAWVLNLSALAIGLVIAPRALIGAFARGRRSRNLYRDEWNEALLDEPLGRVRRRLVPAGRETHIGGSDRLRFTVWAIAAVFTLGTALLAMAVTAPLSLPYLLWRHNEG